MVIRGLLRLRGAAGEILEPNGQMERFFQHPGKRIDPRFIPQELDDGKLPVEKDLHIEDFDRKLLPHGGATREIEDALFDTSQFTQAGFV